MRVNLYVESINEPRLYIVDICIQTIDPYPVAGCLNMRTLQGNE